MQSPAAAAAAAAKPPLPEPEQHLKCPRCDSTNTKFCYYNNYNLSQPRHFCKDCRRYWTKGGALRNIPVGGGTRKNSKRSSASATSGATASKRPSTTSPPPPPSDQLTKPQPISVLYPPQTDSDDRLLDITGSFSSLLASSGGFGNLLEGFGSGASSGVAGVLPNSGDLNRSMGGGVDQLRISSDSNGNENPVALENFMGDSSCWANGWPDLRIYTPGSGFQ